MSINVFQAILIGLWTAFCFSGMLLGIYTNRCIVLSFGVGIILGDLPTALAMGAIGELAYMGFGVGAGGTVPPNPIGPGIFGTLMAITSAGKVSPEAALALSTPIAVAIQFLQTFAYTVRAGAPETAMKHLKNHNLKKFKFTLNATIWLFAFIGFTLGCLGALSMDTLLKLVDYIPPVLLTGLTVAGKMLPAIGFAMILSVMAKKELIPFVLLGYVCAAYLNIPTIGIAIVGTIFALIEFYNTNPHFLPFITSLHLVMLENGRPTKETRSIKMALMGPLAGIGDSLSQFCLAPLFSTIAASFAQEGLVVGPILFFLAMNTILTAIKLSTGLYGYKLGTTVIDKLSEQMATISRIANIIGVTVIAGLAATSVKIMVPITFAAGEVKADAKQSIVSIQGMLDKVAPALLPALFTLLVYYLIKEKKWTTYKLVILTVIIGIIGSWLKIIA